MSMLTMRIVRTYLLHISGTMGSIGFSDAYPRGWKTRERFVGGQSSKEIAAQLNVASVSLFTPACSSSQPQTISTELSTSMSRLNDSTPTLVGTRQSSGSVSRHYFETACQALNHGSSHKSTVDVKYHCRNVPSVGQARGTCISALTTGTA